MSGSESEISEPRSRSEAHINEDLINIRECLEGGSLDLKLIARTKIYHESELKTKS